MFALVMQPGFDWAEVGAWLGVIGLFLGVLAALLATELGCEGGLLFAGPLRGDRSAWHDESLLPSKLNAITGTAP